MCRISSGIRFTIKCQLYEKSAIHTYNMSLAGKCAEERKSMDLEYMRASCVVLTQWHAVFGIEFVICCWCSVCILFFICIAFAQHIANSSRKSAWIRSLRIRGVFTLLSCDGFPCSAKHIVIFEPRDYYNPISLVRLVVVTAHMPLTLWRFDGSSLFNQTKVHDFVSVMCVCWQTTNVMYLSAA